MNSASRSDGAMNPRILGGAFGVGRVSDEDVRPLLRAQVEALVRQEPSRTRWRMVEVGHATTPASNVVLRRDE